jgi:hypothetical protein
MDAVPFGDVALYFNCVAGKRRPDEDVYQLSEVWVMHLPEARRAFQ